MEQPGIRLIAFFIKPEEKEREDRQPRVAREKKEGKEAYTRPGVVTCLRMPICDFTSR